MHPELWILIAPLALLSYIELGSRLQMFRKGRMTWQVAVRDVFCLIVAGSVVGLASQILDLRSLSTLSGNDLVGALCRFACIFFGIRSLQVLAKPNKADS